MLLWGSRALSHATAASGGGGGGTHYRAWGLVSGHVRRQTGFILELIFKVSLPVPHI